MRTVRIVILAGFLVASSTGCQATRGVGGAFAEALFDGIFGSDETYSEEIARQREDEKWKGFWRENPNVNPKMTEAFDNE